MWCDACRSVEIIHCAHPDECGNMLTDRAAAENWNAWLDDLPVGAEFQSGIERLQDFIAGLAMPAIDPAAIREAAIMECANALWNGPIRDYGRAAQGHELTAAHNCRDTILALIPKGATE